MGWRGRLVGQPQQRLGKAQWDGFSHRVKLLYHGHSTGSAMVGKQAPLMQNSVNRYCKLPLLFPAGAFYTISYTLTTR